MNVVLIHIRCNQNGCGNLMAEVRSSGVDGRLVLAPVGRDRASKDGAISKIRYGPEHERSIADPRAYTEDATLPDLTVSCDKHLSHKVPSVELVPYLDERQSRSKPVAMMVGGLHGSGGEQ